MTKLLQWLAFIMLVALAIFIAFCFLLFIYIAFREEPVILAIMTTIVLAVASATYLDINGMPWE